LSMAELKLEGDELVLHLTAGEKILGAHSNPRAPRSAVTHVEVLSDAHGPADKGIKVGERIPGVVEVGTIYSEGRKMFAAVHRNTPGGIRILFNGTKYDEWVVGCADPAGLIEQLGLPH
jgi:hypothetical protein